MHCRFVVCVLCQVVVDGCFFTLKLSDFSYKILVFVVNTICQLNAVWIYLLIQQTRVYCRDESNWISRSHFTSYISGREKKIEEWSIKRNRFSTKMWISQAVYYIRMHVQQTIELHVNVLFYHMFYIKCTLTSINYIVCKLNFSKISPLRWQELQHFMRTLFSRMFYMQF